MRLILITPGYAADADDDCIPALRTLVRALVRRHEVSILALRYPGEARRYELDGASVTALGGGVGFGWRRLWLLARAGRWLRARAASGRVDLVHGLWADEPGFLATVLQRGAGVPALVSLLGGELARLPEIGYGHQLHRAPRWLVARSLRSSATITVGSAWLADRLKEHEAPKLRSPAPLVTPLGIDPEAFAPVAAAVGTHPAGELAPRFLSVASLTPVKAHDDLLAAFARLTGTLPRATLDLVGDGPLRASLEARATELGIASRVRFHGARRHERMIDLYHAADLCVLASRWESQSMVAVEAAAVGRATVGSAVGMLPELAPRELLAAPGDVDGLARVLARAGAEAQSWAAWGERARAAALPRCSAATAVERFEAAYAAAAINARRRPGATR